MMQGDGNRWWRMTPLALVLAVVAVALLLWNLAVVRKTERNNAPQQAEIENMVRKTNDFHASVQKIKDDTRAVMDPMAPLLEMDKRLEAAGLPPLSAKEFTARLAESNRRLIASGSTEYIDVCAQQREVKKHMLYEGIKGSPEQLPGWGEERCE